MAHAFLTRLIFNFPMIKPYLNELEELYILINVVCNFSLLFLYIKIDYYPYILVD